jgi:SAM-dependent methyltransferase
MQAEQELRRLAQYSGDPWVPENPYFAMAEGFMKESWETLIYPFIQDCDFTTTVDLAAGHGRNSTYLQKYARRLYLLDIQEGNISICSSRFDGVPNIEFYVNNGYDFQPIFNDTLTLIYCFDAMVHFEPAVISSYLRDAMRVLLPGGRGFFHHSNYTGGRDWRTNPAARNFMSRKLFADLAVAEGLQVIRQRVINWGGYRDLDCLTVVERSSECSSIEQSSVGSASGE